MNCVLRVRSLRVIPPLPADARRFLALVLGQNKPQLAALFKFVREGDGNMGRLLMRVGAILEGRPDTYDELDAAAKRKATVNTKKIIAEVKTLAELGVTTVQQFTRVLHTTQSLEYSRRVKKLEAQQDGRRQKAK